MEDYGIYCTQHWDAGRHLQQMHNILCMTKEGATDNRRLHQDNFQAFITKSKLILLWYWAGKIKSVEKKNWPHFLIY